MSGGRVTIVGAGRAGSAFAAALVRRGWQLVEILGRGDDVTRAATDTDLVLIATPDDVVADVARAIVPDAAAVVAHLAGVHPLGILEPHPRTASIHPLMSIPPGSAGVERLLSGGWFAVAGDAVARQVVADLGGREVLVEDEHRIRYHAVATMASNHLVALLGQVERLAASIDVPLEVYLDLARGSLESVAAHGPAAALTGPAARGDERTIAAHIEALAVQDRATYVALMREARRLAAVGDTQESP